MNHHNEVVNMLGGGNNNLTDENSRENDIQMLNNGDELENNVDGEREKEDYVECHICGDHILRNFLDRHLKMNHHNEVVNMLGGGNNNLTDENSRENDIQMLNNGDERGDQIMERGEKEDYVECHICGDHILRNFLDRHLKMNHHNEVVNMLGGGNNNLTDENSRENDIQMLNNGDERGDQIMER
jgi:RNA polymerase-binding transcription factor DksA